MVLLCWRSWGDCARGRWSLVGLDETGLEEGGVVLGHGYEGREKMAQRIKRKSAGYNNDGAAGAERRNEPKSALSLGTSAPRLGHDATALLNTGYRPHHNTSRRVGVCSRQRQSASSLHTAASSVPSRWPRVPAHSHGTPLGSPMEVRVVKHSQAPSPSTPFATRSATANRRLLLICQR